MFHWSGTKETTVVKLLDILPRAGEDSGRGIDEGPTMKFRFYARE